MYAKGNARFWVFSSAFIHWYNVFLGDIHKTITPTNASTVATIPNGRCCVDVGVATLNN